MKASPTAARLTLALACAMLLLFIALSLTGCALGLAGARTVTVMPWGQPVLVFDSVGVQGKHGKSGAGALVQGEDNGTLPSGDMVMSIGQNANNARSTDATLADEQSQASANAIRAPQGGTASGPIDQTPTATPSTTKATTVQPILTPQGAVNSSISQPIAPAAPPPQPEPAARPDGALLMDPVPGVTLSRTSRLPQIGRAHV